MCPSNYRVASKFLTAQTFNETAVKAAFSNFIAERLRMKTQAEKYLAGGFYTEEAIDRSLAANWKWLALFAEQIIPWVLETRSIPAGKAKGVEVASRAFLSVTRAPRKITAWMEKNAPYLDLLIESQHWKEKSEEATEDGISEVFTEGSFQVHNTLHLPDAKLELTRKMIHQTEAAIRRSSSKLAKVLYGNVSIVGRLMKANVLAWYYPTTDEVSVRPLVKVSTDNVHNLAHELGHRYWHRFLSREAQTEWAQLYSRTAHPPEVKLPVVGEVYPIKVTGEAGVLYVEEYKGGQIVLTGGALVSAADTYKMLVARATREKFPSAYAATSYSEFFAECFAFYVLDTLGDSFSAEFRRIVGL